MPPIFFNGTELDNLYYNGKKVTAYFNGIKVYPTDENIFETDLTKWNSYNTSTMYATDSETLCNNGIGGWNENYYTDFTAKESGYYRVTYTFESSEVKFWYTGHRNIYKMFGLWICEEQNFIESGEYYLNCKSLQFGSTIVTSNSTNVNKTISFDFELKKGTKYKVFISGGPIYYGILYKFKFKNFKFEKLNEFPNYLTYVDQDRGEATVQNNYTPTGTNSVLSYSYPTYFRLSSYYDWTNGSASCGNNLSLTTGNKIVYAKSKLNSWKCSGYISGGKILSTASSGMCYSDLMFKPTSSSGTVPVIKREAYPYAYYQTGTSSSNYTKGSQAGLTANWLNCYVDLSSFYCVGTVTGVTHHGADNDAYYSNLTCYAYNSANFGYTSANYVTWTKWFNGNNSSRNITINLGFSANKITSSNFPRYIIKSTSSPDNKVAGYKWYTTGCNQFKSLGGTFTASGISP